MLAFIRDLKEEGEAHMRIKLIQCDQFVLDKQGAHEKDGIRDGFPVGALKGKEIINHQCNQTWRRERQNEVHT